MTPEIKVGEKQKNCSNHTLSTLRKRPFGAQRLMLDTLISYENDRAKMKESRQNDNEIRVQEDNITENVRPKSTLTFTNLLNVVAYNQSQKTQGKLERRIVSVKVQ